MSIIKIITYPFSLLYGFILAIRNLCFDLGILKSTRFPVKIISVGNLSVGGTGKTPHVEYLTRKFKDENPAIVLRGYGRTSKGVIEDDALKQVEEVGDEARSYFSIFKGEVPVFVAESRVEGVKELLNKYPATGVVILDDAFQHRSIHRDVNILLVDYNKPFWKDCVLPSGRLREFASGKKRADILIVTKTPENISVTQKNEFKVKMSKGFKKPIFFSTINYGEMKPFYEKTNEPENIENVLVVTGIANPSPLIQELEKKYKVKHVNFKDHYDFTLEDVKKIHELFDTFAKDGKIILTTFKDFMRLNKERFNDLLSYYPWFYQTIEVEIEQENKLNTLIKSYVRKN